MAHLRGFANQVRLGFWIVSLRAPEPSTSPPRAVTADAKKRKGTGREGTSFTEEYRVGRSGVSEEPP